MGNGPITSVFNDGYIAEQYDAFRNDPASVDESWRQFFRFAGTLVATTSPGAAAETSDPSLLRTVASAAKLIDAIRTYGHLAVAIDPLGTQPLGTPELSAEFHGLDEGALARIPGSVVGGTPEDATAADVVDRLRSLYSSNIGFEFAHLGHAEEREWLRGKIESGEVHADLTPELKKAVLRRLTEVDGLERFLGRVYQGYKRFSIEGNDALVPMLDEAIEHAAATGADEVMMAMAHRGRINVLAHTIGKTYETIFEEFEGHPNTGAVSETGDVKYHLGERAERTTVSGKKMLVLLTPNPSHLEFVNPVLQGVARAHQQNVDGSRDESRVVPIVVHGDAAFPGEGVVAETLNLSRLHGFRTGGTIHIIVNNQVGFTTDPLDARSTHYASDLAKGFEVPIVHVNADDPAACLQAMRLGIEYRSKFARDFLIDLVGYRRHGHNETDEPAFTQPKLYEKVRAHPTPVRVWATKLVADGVVTDDEVKNLDAEIFGNFEQCQLAMKAAQQNVPAKKAAAKDPSQPADGDTSAETAVRTELLVALNEQLLAWPSSLKVNPRLAKTLARRRDAFGEQGGIDWGHAEALAFGSLLTEKVSVRLTGQDVERGTFSHRQAVLHDSESGELYIPLKHLNQSGTLGNFEVFNSPLSETAVLGFEYGYSTQSERTLSLWEAQYGDFVNVAQPVIDQFISADRAKWAQDSGIVMLLPHGYEGGGPEHSSARLERFLQLCGENNMRVAYPSTPAQYFHILRRQARLAQRRPLILMQPKSLLRLPEAASKLIDLTNGSFQHVINDSSVAERETVKRLVFCTGKMYYDLLPVRAPHIALVRIEELYPWPGTAVAEIVDLYPNLEEVVWAQEEPKNMGAWSYAAPRLRVSTGNALVMRYIGRPDRASPAEGYAEAHKREQDRIIAEVGAPMQQSTSARKRGVALKT
ncbi:MAG: 2-oxoglutarate dehydrogenase E1 component [Gemmatimonadaceae bacterium]|nr:2-oxoglutarate dehydrogenase E1 component [Gemmatimonadaceae bacterium]